MSDNVHVRHVGFYPLEYAVKHLLGVRRGIGDQRDGDHRRLPRILLVNFRCRNVERVVQASEQGLDYASLLFERPQPRQVKFDSTDANNHR